MRLYGLTSPTSPKPISPFHQKRQLNSGKNLEKNKARYLVVLLAIQQAINTYVSSPYVDQQGFPGQKCHLDLGKIDLQVANRMVFEFLFRKALPVFVQGQAADAVALETAVQRRAGQVRNRGLQRVQAVVQRQQRMPTPRPRRWLIAQC